MFTQLMVVNRVWLFCVFCFGGLAHVVVGVLAVLGSLEVVVYVPPVLVGVELPSVLLLVVLCGLLRHVVGVLFVVVWVFVGVVLVISYISGRYSKEFGA